MRHLVSGGSARKPDHAPHPYDDVVGMAWRSRDADRGRDRDCTIRCGIWYQEDRRGSRTMLHIPTTTQLAWPGDHEMLIVGEIVIAQSDAASGIKYYPAS